MSRNSHFGMIPDIAETFSSKVILELFQRVCLCRFFEQNTAKAFDEKKIECPIYLSLGQEAVAAALSIAFPNPHIFGQHRAHDLYLCYGGDIDALIDELLGRSTGCARGMGGSASIHSPKIKMVGHEGFIGSQVPIGLGKAMSSKEETLIVMGDADLEEGWGLEALGYAATVKKPILFVCVDNDLSVLSEVATRRSWNFVEHSSFGMPGRDITDNPRLIIHWAKELINQLPAILNVRVCRISAHSGTRMDQSRPAEWDRFDLIKQELAKMGLEKEATEIELETALKVGRAWETRLQAKPKKSSIVFIRPTDPPKKIQATNKLYRGVLNENLNLAQTINEITKDHILNHRGVVMGQCLNGAGNVAGTIPEGLNSEQVIELPMSDMSGSGIACGYALDGRRPILVSRYQGFMHFNIAYLTNYAAKAKEMWGYPCPVFARVSGTDGSGGPTIGPVASACHHGLAMRQPGMVVAAPMTPVEYIALWEYYLNNEFPVYCSEHRQAYNLVEPMPDIVYDDADITLLPISSTRLNVLKALPILKEEGIICNVVHLVWLKPFVVDNRILEPLKNSSYGGVVLDSDYENGASKLIAYDIAQHTMRQVRAMGLEDRTSGFARHLDNLPPSTERIVNCVRKVVRFNF